MRGIGDRIARGIAAVREDLWACAFGALAGPALGVAMPWAAVCWLAGRGESPVHWGVGAGAAVLGAVGMAAFRRWCARREAAAGIRHPLSRSRFERALDFAAAAMVSSLVIPGLQLLVEAPGSSGGVPPPDAAARAAVPIQEIFWVPSPPLQAPVPLAAAAASSLLVVLVMRLDFAHPLRLRSPRGRMLRRSLPGPVAGVFAPLLRGGRMQEAALVSGAVAIALWHRGRDGLDLLDALAWVALYLAPVATVLGSGLAFTAGSSAKAAARSGARWMWGCLIWQAALFAAMWTLDSLG